MSSIATRLESIRKERNLSLREFSDRLSEEGFDVSHSTVRDYEKGRTVPADYVLTVASTFDEDPSWILTGEALADGSSVLNYLGGLQGNLDEVISLLRSQLPQEERQEKVRDAWSRFVRDLDPEHSLRDVVVRSWQRSQNCEVDPKKMRQSSRITEEELERRRRERNRLVTYGAQHMSWLRTIYSRQAYYLSLADDRGTILLAESSDRQLLTERSALPGFQWTEEEMGTNAVGTALKEKQSILLIGAEHYAEELQGLVCLGCPITEANEVVGVLGVGFPMDQIDPPLIAMACYTAHMISRDLSQG